MHVRRTLNFNFSTGAISIVQIIYNYVCVWSHTHGHIVRSGSDHFRLRSFPVPIISGYDNFRFRSVPVPIISDHFRFRSVPVPIISGYDHFRIISGYDHFRLRSFPVPITSGSGLFQFRSLPVLRLSRRVCHLEPLSLVGAVVCVCWQNG